MPSDADSSSVVSGALGKITKRASREIYSVVYYVSPISQLQKAKPTTERQDFASMDHFHLSGLGELGS
jgi:hypothetical protein